MEQQGGATFRVSLDRVAQHRKLTLTPLASVLVGYSESAQARWVAWLRKHRPLGANLVANRGFIWVFRGVRFTVNQ